jgi:hypothetical protein
MIQWHNGTLPQWSHGHIGARRHGVHFLFQKSHVPWHSPYAGALVHAFLGVTVCETWALGPVVTSSSFVAWYVTR